MIVTVGLNPIQLSFGQPATAAETVGSAVNVPPDVNLTVPFLMATQLPGVPGSSIHLLEPTTSERDAARRFTFDGRLGKTDEPCQGTVLVRP